MKKLTLFLAGALFSGASLFGASGIFGGYFTIEGTKYKASGNYGGPEPVFDGANFGNFDLSTDSLNLTQAETLAFRDGGSTVFAFAFAYNVRLSSDAKSTNPADYAFIDLGNGVSIGGNDEKGEATGLSVNFLSGIIAPVAETEYAIDVVHKVGANDGGSNFEWLASIANTNPGVTAWGDINAFSATFTVVPEPGSYALIAGALGLSLVILRRRRS
jgi:hypothetical protein